MDLLLKHYLLEWNLKEPVLMAQSSTGSVYRVLQESQSCVLKIFTEVGQRDEKHSAAALKAWKGQGAAFCFQSDAKAVLMEDLIGPNLYFFSGSSQEVKATEVFVEIIKKIHSAEVSAEQFPSLSDLFNEIKPMPAIGLSFYEKAKELSKTLLRSQTRQVLLHGDLHHENVLKRRTGEYVCFDPKGFLGDPCYELGTVLKNPWSYPAISENRDELLRRVNDFSRMLQLPQDRVLKFTFVHCYLSTLWCLEDRKDPNHPLAVLRILQTCLG